MDPKEKYKLFKKSKNFCTAPWNLLYIGVDGSVHSCTHGAPLGKLTENNVKDILSNKNFQSLKKEILADKVTDNCRLCLQSENTSCAGEFKSLRNHYNGLGVHSSVDYHDTKQFKLSALDLHWSSTCDLKCVMCWAGQSSSIAREENKPVNHTPTKVANGIIDFVTENQGELKEIYLSGGEPTLIKHNLRLLKQIEKRSDLLIRVNSHMQWNQNNAILEEILKFPKVLFTCSIDGLGDKFNYIRSGGNWDRTVKNIKFLQDKPNVDLRANTVFFVLTAQQLPEIIDYFMEEVGSVDHTINQCHSDVLSCRNLPDDIKQKVRSQLENSFSKYQNNLNVAGNIQNCLLELDNTDRSLAYQSYFDNIDSRRATSWRKLYPELT